MANTLILVDRRGDPWKKVNVTVVWKGGGYDHFQVDGSGRGSFDGSGTVNEIRVAEETISVYMKVNGSSTVVAKSEQAH